jgi:hypothetical protein
MAKVAEAQDVGTTRNGLRDVVAALEAMQQGSPPADAAAPLKFVTDYFKDMVDALEKLDADRLETLAAQSDAVEAALAEFGRAVEAACSVAPSTSPTPTETSEPTTSVSASPTTGPTASASATVTSSPTVRPSATPTASVTPTVRPTSDPSATPTATPPASRLSLTVTNSGSTYQGVGSGFVPGELISGVFHSGPIALGDVTADADGIARLTWVMPDSVPAGQHRVVFTGSQSGSVEATITLTRPMAGTGASSWAGVMSLGGVAIVSLAGLALLTAARRRREAP